jgi:hypothetical protein
MPDRFQVKMTMQDMKEASKKYLGTLKKITLKIWKEKAQ